MSKRKNVKEEAIKEVEEKEVNNVKEIENTLETTEKKSGNVIRKIWNKVKRPAKFIGVATAVAAVGLGALALCAAGGLSGKDVLTVKNINGEDMTIILPKDYKIPCSDDETSEDDDKDEN